MKVKGTPQLAHSVVWHSPSLEQGRFKYSVLLLLPACWTPVRHLEIFGGT